MSKLREKFIPYTLENKLDVSRSGENNAKQCEQITDDFAIKFAEWLDIEINGIDYNNWQTRKTTTTELLQIFKDKYYEN